MAHFSCGTILTDIKTATAKRGPHPHLKKRWPTFKKRANQKERFPSRNIIRTPGGGFVYRFLFQKLRVGRFEKLKIDTSTGHQFGPRKNAWILVVRIEGLVIAVVFVA